jgi:predicted lipid-binding transport protein (Tim44 family)
MSERNKEPAPAHVTFIVGFLGGLAIGLLIPLAAGWITF